MEVENDYGLPWAPEIRSHPGVDARKSQQECLINRRMFYGEPVKARTPMRPDPRNKTMGSFQRPRGVLGVEDEKWTADVDTRRTSDSRRTQSGTAREENPRARHDPRGSPKQRLMDWVFLPRNSTRGGPRMRRWKRKSMGDQSIRRSLLEMPRRQLSVV